MRELGPLEHDLIYPAECRFRVIAEGPQVQSRIELALRRHGVTSPVTPGNSSSTGKYQTYNVVVRVDNHEAMVALDRTLQAVEGVKTVV